MKRGHILLHEMSENHRGVAVNEGAKGTPLSMIVRTQYKILRPISNKKEHKK
jgi:hypothetical protein